MLARMTDRAYNALQYTLFAIAALCCGVIAIVCLDCISRIALGFGVIE